MKKGWYLDLNKSLKENKLDKTNTVLRRTEIKESTINKINGILDLENLDNIFKGIEKNIENWKKIYLKYWKTIKDKQVILDNVFKNIYLLLNNLSIKRVYNSTSSLKLDDIYEKNIAEQLQLFFRIENEDFIKQQTLWASCNNWNLFAYKLINEITWWDKDIKFKFYLKKSDNHWILYIKIWDKKYSFESRAQELFLWKKKNHRKIFKKDFNKFGNIDDYKTEVKKWYNKKNVITYHFWLKKLKLVKKWWMLTIIYRSKSPKFINIHWLKRLTKNIWKIPNLRYFWFTPKLYNSDGIKEFILSKVKVSDRKDIEIILWNIDNKKLLDFFNLDKFDY